MQSKEALAQSKSTNAILLNRLRPENNMTTNSHEPPSTSILRPKMMASRSTPFLQPGEQSLRPMTVTDKVQTLKSQTLNPTMGKSISNSASSAILSSDVSTRSGHESPNRVGFNPISGEFELMEQSSPSMMSTAQFSAAGGYADSYKSGLLNNTAGTTTGYSKNSFIGSLNLSPSQLHDLFKVPHTFFYLSVKTASPAELAARKAERSMNMEENETMNDLTGDGRGNSGSVYDLQLVHLDQVDKNFYFTLSKEGVTQFRGKVSQFTGLNQWEREYRLFHKIANINFFKVYKRWKVRHISCLLEEFSSFSFF